MMMNPVARRELQERFRNLRSPLLLSAWVLGAGFITWLAYWGAREAVRDRLGGSGFAGLGSIIASSSMGEFILHSLMIALMTAVIFVVPGQAAVTIVGERERQTLQLLQVSQLSARQIIVGKLLSSISFVLLLLAAATPLMVIPVLLGGVSVWQVLGGVGMIAAGAVTIGAISMWVSSWAKSVQGAVVGSYLLTIVLMFGTLTLLVIEAAFLEPETGRTFYASGIPRDEGRELYSSWFNPYIGMVDASDNALEFEPQFVESPYMPFQFALWRRQGYTVSGVMDAVQVYGYGWESEVFFDGPAAPVRPGGFPGSTVTQTVTAEPIRAAVWWKTLAFELALTVLAILNAARLIRAPRHSLRRVRVRSKISDAA